VSESSTDRAIEDSAVTLTVEPAARRGYGFYLYQGKRRAWEYVMRLLSLLCLWELPYEWFFNLDLTFTCTCPL